MGRKRSERTGGNWHLYPQHGELTQSEVEFFKEELKETGRIDTVETVDLPATSE